MIHTHPEYLAFVGEQLKLVTSQIESWENSYLYIKGNLDGLNLIRAAWLAIHDGLVRHEPEDHGTYQQCKVCGMGNGSYCLSLTDITTHLDTVMGQG